AGAAHVADHLAAPDLLAGRDSDAALVAVQGGEAIAVVDDGGVAVAAKRPGGDDHPVGGGPDGRARRGAEVDAGVHAHVPVDGMDAGSEARGDGSAGA